jgi:signal transduction histidine kinase
MATLGPNGRGAPLRLLYTCTALLILALIATNAVVIVNFRESELRDVEVNLKSISLTLAEQADRAFQSVDLVVASVAERIADDGVTDSAAFLQKMAGYDVHRFLREKIKDIPQLNALTLVSRDGKVINFSRAWPIPAIDVSQRDYFRALRDDPDRQSYLSVPIKLPGASWWTIFLAHRLNGPNGEFVGLVVGGVDMRYFENFFRAISLDSGSSMVVMRQDGVMLARFPQTDAIGKVFASSPLLLAARAPVTVREPSPVDGQMRIKAAQGVANYPVIVIATETEQSALTTWRKFAQLILLGAAGCVASIVLAAFAFGRQWRHQATLAEAQAELRRVRFNDAVENIGNPVSIFGPDQRLLVANQAYKSLHVGPDGTTIIRDYMTFSELAEWRVRSGFWAAPPLNVGNVVDGMLDLFHRPSARLSYELADGRSMLVEHRRMIDGSSVATWTDVTAIRAAEAHRRELETQLHHAQKQEALGQLAGGIAHDLNNALTPVLIMTEMAMETYAEGSPEQTNLALAVQGARRSKELVQRILAFTRREVAKKQECDLASVVREAMTMLRAGLPATIELVTRLERVPVVFGDSGQLYQAVINLVTNAAHAIGDAIGKIEVTLRLSDDGSAIRLTVADSGCGMDETTRQRIFDPFFTTKAVNEGTGLGLSIVHGIVTAHGGTIAVTSQRGHGSTFDIDFPIAAAHRDGGPRLDPAADAFAA